MSSPGSGPAPVRKRSRPAANDRAPRRGAVEVPADFPGRIVSDTLKDRSRFPRLKRAWRILDARSRAGPEPRLTPRIPWDTVAGEGDPRNGRVRALVRDTLGRRGQSENPDPNPAALPGEPGRRPIGRRWGERAAILLGARLPGLLRRARHHRGRTSRRRDETFPAAGCAASDRARVTGLGRRF